MALVATILVSALASVCAEILTLPLDTLKIRIQNAPGACVTISDTLKLCASCRELNSQCFCRSIHARSGALQCARSPSLT